MTRRTGRLGAASGIGLIVALVAVGAQQPALKRTVLQQGDMSVQGREAVMARAEFPVGATSGRHTHPGEEISYVLEGMIRLEVDGAAPRMLKAGDVFMIPAGRIHNATNTGTGIAAVVATYVVEKGKPLATPVK